MIRFDVLSLGDHLPDPNRPYNQTQYERYQALVEMGARAEELGFGAFWLGEHHASDYIVPAPQMILAAVASRTRRIRLGTAISLLPNSDPVRLAEEFAMLDLLSKGRAEIGFGSGVTEHTFRLFGQNVEDATAISAENLDLIQRLWRDSDINWSGSFRSSIEDTRLEPRTYSGKPIPITIAIGGSESAARAAGLAGHKLALLTVIGDFAASKALADIYRSAYRDAGHDPRQMSVSAAAYVFTHPDGVKAREHWRPYILNYQSFVMALAQRKRFARGLMERFQVLGSSAMSRQAQMCGEPAEVVEMIERAYEDIGGFDELKVLFDVGGLPPAEVFESMHLFADKVVPKVRVSTALAANA